MNRIVRLLLCSLLALGLGACAAIAQPSKLNARDQALSEYGAAIRWSEFDRALEFLDPSLRGPQALTDLERERFKQLQVTGYEVKSKAVGADLNIEQVVEIRLINKNTQLERSVVDHQRWRWDAVSKRYWLSSGLPDFSAQ
jgi:hypothetical protein